METFPARLHIILARNATTAIVIRRGPSKWCATFGWDRNGDTIRLGQWLHGRIYERRCDLSPDGKHFLYFVVDGKWGSEVGGAYTGLSRAPYLKALGLWGQNHAWAGGGLFVDKQRYWLNRCSYRTFRNPTGLIRAKDLPGDGLSSEDPSYYYVRLRRDEWLYAGRLDSGRHNRRAIFEKHLPHGWRLRKIAYETLPARPGRSYLYDEHELLHDDGEKFVDGHNWEWADWDPVQDRLVWAAGGCLYSARLGKGGLMEESLIHDFNPYRFEPVVAPY